MRKFEYQLEKDDYRNWIHWSVSRNRSSKKKLFTLVLYIGVIVLLLGRNLISAKGNLAVIFPSIFVAILVGGTMFYITSSVNQERMIWKKSGLRKMELTNSFPYVHLTLEEKGLTLEVKEQDARKHYNYREIDGIKELDRLFLLETSDQTCQFISRAAFENKEEADEFKAFIEEKIKDAKENPEKYEEPELEETDATADADSGSVGETVISDAAQSENDAAAAETAAEETEEPVIAPVDTSGMGKIGKMAHIMASMAAEADDAEETNEQSAADTAQAEDVQSVAGDAEPAEVKMDEESAE